MPGTVGLVLAAAKAMHTSVRHRKLQSSTVNNFLSAETRKLKSKKEIIKMEEIKEKLRAFIQEKFEIDDDPDFTDDVHLFTKVLSIHSARLK